MLDLHKVLKLMSDKTGNTFDNAVIDLISAGLSDYTVGTCVTCGKVYTDPDLVKKFQDDAVCENCVTLKEMQDICD